MGRLEEFRREAAAGDWALCLYLAEGISVPMPLPAEAFLGGACAQVQAADLSTDAVSWQYLQRWMREAPRLLLAFDAPEGWEPDAAALKPFLSRLLPARGKCEVLCSPSALPLAPLLGLLSARAMRPCGYR
jgi:hypothetical protein